MVKKSWSPYQFTILILKTFEVITHHSPIIKRVVNLNMMGTLELQLNIKAILSGIDDRPYI